MIFFAWTAGALALLLIGLVQLLWGLLRMLFYAMAIIALAVLRVLFAVGSSIRQARHTA